MSTKLLPAARIPVDEQTMREARETVALPDVRDAVLILRFPDGTERELPTKLETLLGDAIRTLTQQGSVSLGQLPDELTSTVAADLLSVSRPTLMKWVQAGEIDSYRVGSHTRFQREVVLSKKAEIKARQRKAFEALRAFDDEFGDAFED
ncbi:helix-turn-helix domain-containing protein [Kocuria sp.]|uniref:helix-turn-helix domain-containing protein n=1 Tax=Kocuria sp. TaxID=1871328 RepID=UPI0026E11278|nr:helix-turn-helix domain-containing protein [Kocuria sp.]MDO5617888.1 helix-turn-helix domain-containing protein [Kocuria sp.]